MMRHLIWLIYLTNLLPLASTAAVHSPFKQVYQFPNETWIENFAVRSNGNLLLTVMTTHSLYQLDPLKGGSADLIYTFPGVTGIFGITEYGDDQFAVVAGNYSQETLSTSQGTFSIWTVNMQSPRAHIEKALDVPEGQFLNGLTTLSKKDRTLLVGDAAAGVVFRVDLDDKDYSMVLEEESMVAGNVAHIGVNGIFAQGGCLYYTNTDQGIFVRIPINPDGTAAGDADILVQNRAFGDDFALRNGKAWVTQVVANEMYQITGLPWKAHASTIPGSVNSTLTMGSTSARFGRTKVDNDILYITTNGGILGPVPGSPVVGGMVVAYDTRSN